MVTLSRASLGTGRLQFLNEPSPIEVRGHPPQAEEVRERSSDDPASDAGLLTPDSVLWQQRWRRVMEVLERWRIDDEWWRSRPVSRLYYAVLLEGGKRLEIYHDLVDGRWYAQR